MFATNNVQTVYGRSIGAARSAKGIALVSVLWLLLLLTTIVISLSRETQLAAKTAQIYVSEVQAKATIEGAVDESIFQLLKGTPFTVLQTNMHSGGIQLALSDLNSQVDVNTASQTQLATALSVNAIPNADELAKQIIQFREESDGSRESREKCFNHNIDLARVPGISIDMIKLIRKELTVLEHTITGRVVSLALSTKFGSTSLHANVTVRFTGASNDPYRILSWHWTTG